MQKKSSTERRSFAKHRAGYNQLRGAMLSYNTPRHTALRALTELNEQRISRAALALAKWCRRDTLMRLITFPLLIVHAWRWLPEGIYALTRSLQYRWWSPTDGVPGVIVLGLTQIGYREVMFTEGAAGRGGYWGTWSSPNGEDIKRVYCWRHIDGGRDEPWHEVDT